MQPTYSVPEIKLLIKDLDSTLINVLRDLIDEEKERFLACELKAVYKFIELKNKARVSNQVKVEFLLSFN